MALVDWGTVISTGITGLVGLAGIGGTILATRLTAKSATKNLERNISAEDARGQRAEKRLIYANCLAALSREREAELAKDEQQLSMARTASWIAFQEIRLIGNPQVVLSTEAVLANINEDEKYRHDTEQLVREMRADLAGRLQSRGSYAEWRVDRFEPL